MDKNFFSNAEKIAISIVILVSILTVIYALKPADFKKKNITNIIMEDIDNALSQVILNHSPDGNLKKLYKLNSTKEFDISKNQEQSENLGILMKKYLDVSDNICKNESQCGKCAEYKYTIALKNGACIGITTGKNENVPTIFPGEKTPSYTTSNYGVIFFDTNSINAPNKTGEDQFLLPLGVEGIEYVAGEEE